MALMAYARVSTEGQTLAAQVAQLKAAGAETIFKEKVSGVRADRPQLRKALAALEPDDVFYQFPEGVTRWACSRQRGSDSRWGMEVHHAHPTPERLRRRCSSWLRS